jgi:predicted nucleic acid-binding protein
MKEALFIDTWGWIVIHNKREPRHSAVDALYRKCRLTGNSIYTTDYVLDETFTLLFRRLPLPLAEESVEYLDKAIGRGYLNLEWVSPERFEEAKVLRLRFRDKPKMSFTDLTSMVIMREIGVTSILTDDDHFMQIGMGFKKMP